MKTLQTNISLSLGLFVFLYLSHTFDKITLDAPYAIQGSSFHEILKWIYPAMSLFIGAVVLLSFWLMQNKLHQQRWVEILYLGIGLVVVSVYNLTNVKMFQPLLFRYTFGGSVPIAILLQNTFWPNTYLHIAGSLIAVSGLLLLILPRDRIRQQDTG